MADPKKQPPLKYEIRASHATEFRLVKRRRGVFAWLADFCQKRGIFITPGSSKQT